MHITLTASLLVLAIFKGNWREWEKYHLTIFYVIICNLLYNHLAQNKLLWKYTPDFYPSSHIIVELLYTFINLPAITLLFLSFYPFKGSLLTKIKFTALWTASSLAVEYPFYLTGRIQLQNGYEFWMDGFFYIVMYSMIRLHHSRPFLTYAFSIMIVGILLWVFKIPLS